MRDRWWRGPIAGFEATVARFAADPFAPEFAPVHYVAEPYAHRTAGVESLPLVQELREASTLRQLAETVYHLPVSALQVMNPQLNPDDRLAPGTEVSLPDRKFAPLLAARFAAEALARPMPQAARVSLIRQLVPAASVNETTLDAVLSRLLLAGQPFDPPVLAALRDAAPDVWMDEPHAAVGIEA
jgi:hypothetical protein